MSVSTILDLLSAYTVSCQVKPDVLGGIIVDFGDKNIDLSVASTVNKLNGVLQREC